MAVNTHVIADKFTTHMDQPFVVFLLGMRINKLLHFNKWKIAFFAFPDMLHTLEQHPEKGFLGGDLYYTLVPFSTVMISYWRSYDDLERFARAKDDPHLPAWRAFNQQVGYGGSVGVWHEAYLIEPGKYEALYGGMPQIGLARASGHIDSVTRGAHHLRKGRGRLTGQEAELAAELEVYE